MKKFGGKWTQQSRFWLFILITPLILGLAGGLLFTACKPQEAWFSSHFVEIDLTPETPPTQSWAFYGPRSLAGVEITPAAMATPIPPTATPLPFMPNAYINSDVTYIYHAQWGDTLKAIARRFDATQEDIYSPDPLPENGLINPGQILIIPNPFGNIPPAQNLMPDSEVVYSPSTSDFNIKQFVSNAGGYLSEYVEWNGRLGWLGGAEIVGLRAQEHSINPLLLLALIEYQSGWVYRKPDGLVINNYPLGFIDPERMELGQQLKWAVDQLSTGYYGWRDGSVLEVDMADGYVLRMAPGLNAGTAALQYFFGQVYDYENWSLALNPTLGFPALYERMFGDPWQRAHQVEPLYAPDLAQPELTLPFERDVIWSLSGGPHGAWDQAGALGALDFAPNSNLPGCVPSNHWVTASAPGLVIRSDRFTVVIDLDSDGNEQTGWNIIYLHILNDNPIPPGTVVQRDDKLGHPSCEGGVATGTHVHMVRKYNGEWIIADGPIPFVIGGWQAHAGAQPYDGYLTRNGKIILANLNAYSETFIARTQDDP